jgi:hypothetical protein
MTVTETLRLQLARGAATLLVLAAHLADPQVCPARGLDGGMSMGDALCLIMDLKEGTISEVLRFMKVRSAPREQIDLTRLGESGDCLFIGSDYFLYCQKKPDGNGGSGEPDAVRVGRAHKLWEIKLAEGVKLAEVQDVMGSFTGAGGKRSLKVTVPAANVVPKAPDVEKAGIKFWLDEVVYQYDSPGSRKGKMDNYQVISRSVLAALPSRSDDAQEKFNNFKVLRAFLKESKDGDLVAFRDLFSKKLAAIAGEQKQTGSGDVEKFEPIVKEFESMKADVFRRTEGF